MKLKLYSVLPFIIQSTLWRILMRPFFYIFPGFEVHGLEHLKSISGAAIFAPNHSHELDSVLLPLALPLWGRFSPMYYVVRESKFYSDPFFKWRKYIYGGWIFTMLGAYPVRSGVKNYEESLKNHVQILKDGGSVCIFPEGGFSKTGEIGSAHGGVGYLAFATGVPVVPVLIKGSYGLTGKSIFARRGAIEFHFLSPIQVEDLFVGLDTTDIESMRAAGNRILDRLKQKQAARSV